jgi:hypothetical protein
MELINKDNSHTSQFGFSSTSVGGKKYRRRTKSRNKRTKSRNKKLRYKKTIKSRRIKRKQRGGINVNPTYSSYSTVGELLTRSESALASTPGISKITKIY